MFKKGDKVKIIGGFYKGETGEVIDHDEDFETYLVDVERFLDCIPCRKSELVSTEDTPTETIEKELKTMFKKGDKVKIRRGVFKGRIGEFIKTLETPEFIYGGNLCLVQGVDFEGIFFTGNLELVSTETIEYKLLLNRLYGDLDSTIYYDTDSVEHDLENNILKPNHYQSKNGDLFDEWYERYPFDVFRIVLLATAERYFRRYHLKDGLDGLNKGIEVMKRLEEYELKEKTND